MIAIDVGQRACARSEGEKAQRPARGGKRSAQAALTHGSHCFQSGCARNETRPTAGRE